MDITGFSELKYFRVANYRNPNGQIDDFSGIPRPYNNIALIISGEAEVNPVDGATFFVKPGDIFFIPVGTKYISKWIGNDVNFITFHFNISALSYYLLPGNDLIQKINIGCLKETREKFETAYRCFEGEWPEKLNALSIFYDILSRVISKAKLKRPDELEDKRIKDAINFITFHYKEKITVLDCAESVYMSEPWFYVKFKKATGMTPIEFKNRIAINQACIMLINTDKSIEKISEELGFASADYFRRVFKKTVGISPLKYRKTPIDL